MPVDVTLPSPNHVQSVSVPRTAQMSGVRCTVDGARFILRSVVLPPPFLHLWSELFPNIATIPKMRPVRPNVSHHRDHQTSACANCIRAVTQFMQSAIVGIAHNIVPVLVARPMRPQTGRGRDSGARRTIDSLSGHSSLDGDGFKIGQSMMVSTC